LHSLETVNYDRDLAEEGDEMELIGRSEGDTRG
jgi:hypothetical protein